MDKNMYFFLLNIQSMSIQSLCLVTAKSTRDHRCMMNSIDLFPFQFEITLQDYCSSFGEVPEK
jgi:hypothetical protein